jgi:transposase
VSSRSVKALRERYGTSGNKSDRSDAYVLADCLRTDGHRGDRWSRTHPRRSPSACHVRARKDLVETRVAVANQLRAHLRIVFPGAVGLFSALDSPISLRFLERFPSAKPVPACCRRNDSAHGYVPTATAEASSPAVLYGRLSAAPAGIIDADGDARGAITLAYVNILTTLRAQIDELTTRLDGLLDAHPDAHIFRSLPRCATVRAATLLAEIGDCRARFPDAESLCCLAGVAPSTRASGRHRAVTFRWSADKKLRRRTLRLRRRQLARQRLGRTALPATTRRRQEPPPRRTHPRTQLGPHHLALLARQHRLRPHPPRQPPTPHPTRSLT